VTFPALLRRNAAEHGAKRAVVTAEDAITHAELDERSRALAAELGLGPGMRVGLQARNGIDWVVQAAAVMRSGAVLVPLSTLLKPPELGAQLAVAEVTHVLPEAGSSSPVEPVDPDDDLVILFTSGSRGTPKGVRHTHRSALGSVAASLAARTIGPDDRLYVPMPFFWTGGFATGFLSALVAGCTLLTEAVPEPGATLALLERERVTLFRGWPDQAAALAADPRFAAADLSSLRDGSLAAVLPPERRPAPGARPNIFGMTETCGPWCGDRLDLDLPEAKRGSCGRPFDGFEVREVDGELQVRGPNVMAGICGRAHDGVFTPDGWYPTGDLGRIDEDGYVWFSGRADDMFKVKGATVYPSEVEAALRSVPGVQQAHVTDLGALVVTDLALEDVVAAARARLSSFKVPTAWVVAASAEAVPLTATAKVDKGALQALLQHEGIRP
jgi:acyl-CoA synthetase (AMP-forming)/AMP-acid ligase II